MPNRLGMTVIAVVCVPFWVLVVWGIWALTH